MRQLRGDVKRNALSYLTVKSDSELTPDVPTGAKTGKIVVTSQSNPDSGSFRWIAPPI